MESILSQTVLPHELVVSDDRSSDDTAAIVAEFTRRASFPVRFSVNANNLGSTKNFEHAIKLCSGDIIFLADQDDVWRPDKIQKIAAEFERSEVVGLVFTDAELTDENLRSLNRRLWDYTFTEDERSDAIETEFYRTLVKRNVVTGATTAFRSRFVKDILPIPGRVPNTIHDGWIALVISASAEIRFLPEPLIKYRQHSLQQLGVRAKTENSGPMREVFPRTIRSLKQHKDMVDALAEISGEYDALRREPKIGILLAESASEACEYIVHLEKRLELFDKGLGRLPMMLSELKSGRYHRFSRGYLSFLKDMFTP